MNKRLLGILAEVFGLRSEQILPDLSRDDLGNWDSLKQMDLVISLEREFNIVLEIDDIIKMDSVGNIAKVLVTKGVDLELNGAIALISGGAKGLGLTLATYLQAQGTTVIVADIDKQALAGLPQGIEGYALDVTCPTDAQAVVKSITDKFGRIDILVNNAGIIYSEPMVNLMNQSRLMHDYGQFRKSIVANLDSVFIMSTVVIEQMVRSRVKGVIINMSSISACGNAGQTAYSAAKAGVNAMTVVWSKELGKLGIRCNAVAPGFIDTQSTRSALNESIIKHIKTNTPLQRLGQAEEVAQAVEFCITNDYVNGIVLSVNGGLTI